jgi:UrcA family protein
MHYLIGAPALLSSGASIMKLTPIALAAALTIAPSVTQQSEHRASIAHADLDLSTRDGRARLDRRIGRAARELCGTWSAVDLAGRTKVMTCRNAAIAQAADQRDRLTGAARTIEVAQGR